MGHVTSAASPFSWEVALPQRASRTIGQRPARATVDISTEDRGDEAISVPVAVGRRLESMKKSGEARPASRAELLYLVGEVSRSCGRSRVEGLVNRRDYSSSELAEKLRADGYSQVVVDELVGRAQESGVIDDARFADVFIRSKVSAGWGKVKISRELERRGIRADEVPGWPEEYLSDEDERGRALELARRRRLTGKNDYEKIVRFIGSRGFSLGIACDVARQVLDEADEDED